MTATWLIYSELLPVFLAELLLLSLHVLVLSNINSWAWLLWVGKAWETTAFQQTGGQQGTPGLASVLVRPHRVLLRYGFFCLSFVCESHPRYCVFFLTAKCCSVIGVPYLVFPFYWWLTGVIWGLGLWWIKLLWASLYMPFGLHTCSLSAVYLRVEILGHRVCICPALVFWPQNFPKWLYQFIFPPVLYDSYNCFSFFTKIEYCHFRKESGEYRN